MAWGYRSTSGNDSNTRDYSGSADYSRPPDHSRPADYSRPTNDTKSSLGRAEQQAASLVPGYKDAQKAKSGSRDIAGLENASGGMYSKGHTPPSRTAGKGAKGKISSKLKAKVAAVIIGAVLAVVSAVFGPVIMGTLGILQFYEKLNSHFINLESVMARRANAIVAKKVNDSNRTPGIRGLCAGPVKVACRYSGMSNRAIRNLEKHTGIKVNVDDGRFHLPGRSAVSSVTLPSGEVLDAQQFHQRMRASGPDGNDLRRMMRQAMRPRVAVWASAKVQALFRKLKLDKLGGFIKENTVDKAKQMIKERQKGGRANVEPNKLSTDTGDADKNADHTNKNNINTDMVEKVKGNNPQIQSMLDAGGRNSSALDLRGAVRGGVASVGGMTDIRDQILGAVTGGNTDVVRKVCGFVQNMWVRGASAVIGLVVGAFSAAGLQVGQMAAQAILWGAVFTAISFLMPVVARMMGLYQSLLDSGQHRRRFIAVFVRRFCDVQPDKSGVIGS